MRDKKGRGRAGPSRREVLKWGAGTASLVALGAVGGGYALAAEAEHLVIERVEIRSPRLPRAWEGLTVAQLSDLHHGPLVGIPYLERAVEMTNALHPDLIALTGDFFTGAQTNLAPCLGALARLQAPLGIWAVPGNHEYWGGFLDRTFAEFRATPIRLLRNEWAGLKQAGEEIVVAGLDDVYLNRQDLALALKGTEPERFTLLLVHEPDSADEAAKYPVDLQLSGHSHGGQVRLPGIGPIILPRHGRKYPAGLYNVGARLQTYTTRGVGLVDPAVRFNCPPEITLLTLRRAFV